MSESERKGSALDRLRQIEAGERKPDGSGARRGGGARRNGVIGAVVVALIFLLTKLKFIAGVLKLGVAAPTLLSMALAIGVYATATGTALPFWALLVGLILVHELGHGGAALALGLRVGAPIFIPFFGAAIALRDRPQSAYHQFLISAAGPFVGSLGCALCLAISAALDGDMARLLFVVGYFGLTINLFNLTPIWILDGRAMFAPLTGRQAVVSATLVTVAFVAGASIGGVWNPAGLAVAAVSIFSAVRKIRGTGSASALDRLAALGIEKTQLEEMSSAHRLRAAAGFTGLAVVLILAVALLPFPLAPP